MAMEPVPSHVPTAAGSGPRNAVKAARYAAMMRMLDDQLAQGGRVDPMLVREFERGFELTPEQIDAGVKVRPGAYPQKGPVFDDLDPRRAPRKTPDFREEFPENPIEDPVENWQRLQELENLKSRGWMAGNDPFVGDDYMGRPEMYDPARVRAEATGEVAFRDFGPDGPPVQNTRITEPVPIPGPKPASLAAWMKVLSRLGGNALGAMGVVPPSWLLEPGMMQEDMRAVADPTIFETQRRGPVPGLRPL